MSSPRPVPGPRSAPLVPVLLCGGSGTRLWPASRSDYPKQFLALSGQGSLLQQTVERVAVLDGADRIVAVGNEEHRFLLAEQLRQVHAQADILLEPVARNTAPAIAAAAHRVRQRDPSAIMLVLPSDHLIADVAAFQSAVSAGLPHARDGRFVTFGIVPHRPETGYGYIQRGSELAGGYAIARFVEKPDARRAEEYLRSGEYYWNSGMFLFRADVYLDYLAAHRPDIAAPVADAARGAAVDHDFIRLARDAFAASASDSIDYAVMEQVRDAVVVPLDAGWNDIGAWDALLDNGGRDDAGNLCSGDVIAHDTRDCLLRAESRLLATIGVRDLVVVETADAVLVADVGRAQDVRQIVARLKAEGRSESDQHPVVHRPWGTYQRIAAGPRFQVKRICVQPGHQLSLQQHHHRSEHWVVVTGTALVRRGDEEFLLAENASTYIPVGTLHRLSNPGKIPLELIEVQAGAYLGEDDIVRFEDIYGRQPA